MKTAYFDCFSGISGDMCLGAIVDAGVDMAEIKKSLIKIPIKNYSLLSEKVLRSGISATRADVVIKKSGVKSQESKVKKWNDITKLIKNSSIPDEIKKKGLHIFKGLFEAEARVHGESLKTVHLHELGAIDCIVDIFGTLIGLDILGVKKIYISAINLGGGTVKTAHGILPVPAPATAELLKGYPVYSSGIPFELTTPTGAAIISGLKSRVPAMPKMKVERIGYGAGSKDIEGMPNVLRILVGEEADFSPGAESITIIETNIDDMNPQLYENVVDKLFAAGALDVFLENIIMKKGRPAVKLTVMADEGEVEDLSDILFRETTSIGLRFYKVQRKTLGREIKRIKTRYGEVRVKIARLGNDIVNISPEFDDLKTLSKKTGLPAKRIAGEVFLRLKNLRIRG